jgi:hypothetical protein
MPMMSALEIAPTIFAKVRRLKVVRARAENLPSEEFRSLSFDTLHSLWLFSVRKRGADNEALSFGGLADS